MAQSAPSSLMEDKLIIDALAKALKAMLAATQWLGHAEALDKAEAQARAALAVAD